MSEQNQEARRQIDPIFKQVIEERFASYELPIIQKNYPLLLFASSKRKFREFLEQVVAEGEATYIRYAYEVRPKLTKEVLTMAGISYTLTREDLEFMADDIGRELVAVMNPKDVLEGMDSEKQRRLLSLFSPEDRLADMSIEELLKGMNPEKQKTLLEFLLKIYSSPKIA